jgi:ATP-dependent Lon protease
MEVAVAPAVGVPEDVVALVPMRNVVLFPQVLLPITVGRARSLAAHCSRAHPST